MPIKLRTFVQQPEVPAVGRRIKQRHISPTYVPVRREFADNIEEYVFSVPKQPMRYVDLVINWIVPYQHTVFVLFGVNLKLTPMYQQCSDDLVKVSGLLVEIKGSTPTRKQKITGPVGAWHGKIKFFAKANVGTK